MPRQEAHFSSVFSLLWNYCDCIQSEMIIMKSLIQQLCLACRALLINSTFANRPIKHSKEMFYKTTPVLLQQCSEIGHLDIFTFDAILLHTVLLSSQLLHSACFDRLPRDDQNHDSNTLCARLSGKTTVLDSNILTSTLCKL